MFYAISGINGDYEAYKRALKKLKFQNLDDIKEEDIMNEEAVISTLEGEDVPVSYTHLTLPTTSRV